MRRGHRGSPRDPIEVVLIGSYARGEATSASDFDLVVVMPEGTARRATAKAIYSALVSVSGRKRAVDIVVMTPSQLDRGRSIAGTLARAVDREGRSLYRRGAPIGA